MRCIPNEPATTPGNEGIHPWERGLRNEVHDLILPSPKTTQKKSRIRLTC